jgi:uncharacterized membrane protein
VPSNPTVAFSPSLSQSVPAGTSVTYTLSVINNDNTACPASSFTLQATAPTGWSAALASSTLALSPGVGVSTTLQITSPVSATPGIYPIGVTAGNSASAGFSASASTTLKVAGPLTVGVSTTQSSYVRGQSVFVTANVSDNGSPMNRAKVTFSVTKPNGIVVTKTISTKTNGAAIYKFRLGSSSPIGAYQVRGDANLKNVRFGSAVTSFTVQ